MIEETLEGDFAHSREQLYRPSQLARACEPLTRLMFIRAGLAPGMRVLDVFSGSGDVALLAREFVGAHGHVKGFDRPSATISHANERAAFYGLRNVEFVEGDIESLPFGSEFDAIVGRMALMFRRDPVRDLRALLGYLRPRGVVVFQELDLLGASTVPPSAVIDDARGWLLHFLAASGVELEMGSKLYRTFKAAGFDDPQMRVEGLIGGSESPYPEVLADVARQMLPAAEAMGAIRAKEVQIDTLEQRMRADLAKSGGVMSTAVLISAWARVPD